MDGRGQTIAKSLHGSSLLQAETNRQVTQLRYLFGFKYEVSVFLLDTESLLSFKGVDCFAMTSQLSHYMVFLTFFGTPTSLRVFMTLMRSFTT